MPIALHERMDKFQTHEINLIKGDCLYMFSDGFADQFGGEKGKKLNYKAFKELLLNIAQKDMKHQVEKLKIALQNWQGNFEQVDDIIIAGIMV